jgi:hypothetical protein
MKTLQIKRNIRFATVEKADAWVVLAVLVEIHDGRPVPVSEAKVVKIISKKFAALTGNVKKNKILALTAPKNFSNKIRHGIISPFCTSFKYLASNSIPWFSAQPPTN